MPDIGQILEMLERDQALEDQDPSDTAPWPQIEPEDQILELDYDRLFPARVTDRGVEDFEVYGDQWEITDEAVEDILSTDETVDIAGRPGSTQASPPQWDIWAWYQPIHFFGPGWGIFIREVGLLECARRMAALQPRRHLSPKQRRLLAKALIRSAFAVLFLHEQYHHKTESLALRMHVVERRAIYPKYHRLVYRATGGTDRQIEEGLANADSYFRINGKPYATWLGPSLTRSARVYLKASFSAAPPGYRNASRLLTDREFADEQQFLSAQVQEGLAPTRATPSEFGIATHLNQSLFSVSQHIWAVVTAGRRSILPTRTSVSPLATMDLKRILEGQGCVEVRGGKGSHQKFRCNGKMVILPHAKDVSPPVLRNTAETLGVTIQDLRRGRLK